MLAALASIARYLLRVGPTVLPLVVDLVRQIASSSDPERTARRALTAAASEQASDAAIGAAYPGTRR